jgi:hypothetical protein
MSLKAGIFVGNAAGAAAETVFSAAALPRARTGAGALRNGADAWLIAASMIYVTVVVFYPRVWTIGPGIWWMLNTVAHNFIHQPFFRSPWANRAFALGLSVMTGVPQRSWRERHMAHHAGREWRFRFSRELAVQGAAVAGVWVLLLMALPGVTVRAVLPGFALGMALCWMQGYFEHAQGTTSNYGAIYNWLFFNDGFHVEHHRRPAAHWTTLPKLRSDEHASRWPAVLRWLECFNLNRLEGIVAKSPVLQRWVVRVHAKGLRRLTRGIAVPKSVAIIGGGLFPRTALVVHEVWPEARITILEADARHLAMCRRWLRADEELVHARVRADALPAGDLIVVPLAFDQSKQPLYSGGAGRNIVVHDWLWRRGARSVITSVLLLKRMNLVTA